MEVKEMTISDVLKTPEFYNNLKVVISDLENTRRKAGMMADAPLKRHPIDRLQERGVFEPGQMTVLYANAMDKKLQGYSSSERTFILKVGGEAFNKTMKRIPRKLKKIAKNAISYGTNEFYNFYQRYNLPKNGVVFYIPGNIKKNKKGHHVVKFGKKVREAYYNGLFDF